MSNLTFGERISKMRKKRGFSSQVKFAKALCVSPASVNYYENNDRKPDYEIFSRIADVLDVSYDYLLGKSENPKRENVAIGAITGLSDDSIRWLSLINERRNIDLKEFVEGLGDEEAKPEDSCSDIESIYQHKAINKLLETHIGRSIINDLACYLYMEYTDQDGGEKSIDIWAKDRYSPQNKKGVPIVFALKDINAIHLTNLQLRLADLKRELDKENEAEAKRNGED